MSEFSQAVREARLGRKLSQAKLAALCAVDPATIARFEQGKSSPSSRLRAALLRTFPDLRALAGEA